MLNLLAEMTISTGSIIGYLLGGLATLYAAGQAIDFFKRKRKEHRDAIANEALEEKKEEKRLEKLERRVSSLESTDEKINSKLDKIAAEQEIGRQQFIIETHAWMYRMWFECKKRGYVTPMDLQTIEERYEFYKSRGGNSYVDDLVDEIRHMETRDAF